MRLVCLSLCCLLSACPADPVYNEEIGVQAISAAVGSLAGTFALKTINQTLVRVPVLGDYAGGGSNYRLVTRSWNGDAAAYDQTSQLCGGFNFEVAGVTASPPEATYRKVPPSIVERVIVDHELGGYEASDHLQLWGLRDLPEPFSTPLPANLEEAAMEPHASRIYDMDEDNNAGITTVISGAVSGEVYVAQRKTVSLRGVILGADQAVGLATNTNEVVSLGNNNTLLDRQNEGSAEPHPNPKRSYFQEVRLPDDATCDDVMSAQDDGLLSITAPFPTDEE
jgi:hypothetical protein